MMDRRTFAGSLGGAAAFAAFDARAQVPAMPVIWFLGSASPNLWIGRLRAFHQGLGEIGYLEGRNVAIEYRWAEGHNDQLSALAADLVRRQVKVIAVIGNTPSALAAKAATATIPIVFRVAVNPVESGLVASLGRPGGNITGVTTLGVELGSKQLEFLHEMVPAATRFAMLINPTNPVVAETHLKTIPAAAASLGLELHFLRASTDGDFEAVFTDMLRLRVAGLMISADAFLNSRNEVLAKLAIQHRVPAISPYREFVEAGGLSSYGGSINDGSRQAGVCTARILNGEKPANLPVHEPTKLEFVVNIKTANALGLTISQAIMLRIEEVVEYGQDSIH